MNKNLEEIVKTYSTKAHCDFTNALQGYSKDSIISLFSDLLTLYINDKNSSTIREFITVSLAGYKHSIEKIGFNGFKQDSIGKAINCEAKPKNFSTQDFLDYKNKIKKTRPSNLDGGGNFTDYTWARFKKDKNTALNMLMSGFVDGQLIYILEVPFNENAFLDNLEKQLERKFPKGDEKNNYLKNAHFNFSHYKGSAKLKIIFVLSQEQLVKFKDYIKKDLYEYLFKAAIKNENN
ncbi:MAG: hypothetical protein LBV66_02045 [Elusimicrobiota bacterium]|jgi:hypothetical protein|nr:hypothetical protein [Elusimicrobiota bacterium]